MATILRSIAQHENFKKLHLTKIIAVPDDVALFKPPKVEDQ